MTIREVLEADWNVDRIDVTVRERETAKYIMRYCIGKDVSPGRSQRFLYKTEIGDVCGNSDTKALYINRIIQFNQLENKPQGKTMCHGVLLEEIPKELLDLTIVTISPYQCGYSNDFHAYDFNCYADTWSGIAGEYEQDVYESGEERSIMGVVENIDYDHYPAQADENYKYPNVGKRVKVCYRYDTSRYHHGVIARDDIEAPEETIIKLDKLENQVLEEALPWKKSGIMMCAVRPA